MRMKQIGAIAACLFAATQGVCETETVEALSLTADMMVDVPAGVTQNVVRLMGGAYTLTKTGLGTLNIYWTSNENAKVVVEEGTFALRQYPKPTAVFAKAHFHVDASDPSTMVTECVNGTNFVVRWNDADGRTCYATNCPSTKIGRKNPQDRRAFLRSHFQNGLPVVDFGSLASKGYTNEQGVALGYGGAMNWSEPMFKTFREGFTVFSDTEDIYDEERAAYGGWPAAPFASYNYIGNFRHALPGAQFFVNTTYSLPLGRGTNILDIVKFMGPQGGYSNKPGEGFHILNGITTSAYIGTSYDKYHVDAFAAELCNSDAEASFGGQRIGEYAVFDDYLTEQERMEVSLYLKTKWFPRKFVRIMVRGDASFDAGEGGVECADFVNESTGSVSVGRLPLETDPLLFYPTVLHLDASASDTLDTVNVGGTNFVRKWVDVRGNGAYATNHFDDAHMPFISPDVTQNGLPVVDFGSLRTPYNTNEVGEALGYGAAMALSSTMKPHEGITVISDTPDVVDGTWSGCDGFAEMFGMSFFSRLGLNGEYYQSRGRLRSDGAPYVYSGSGNNNPYANGTNIVDGVWETNPRSYAIPSGFHVVDVSPRAPGDYFRCTHLAAQKQTVSNASYGGQRIAEYILFNPKLTETERDRVYRALRKKWFGEANERTNSVISVPEGSSYSVQNEDIVVSGELTLGGTLSASSVSAARIAVESADANVAAPLALASGATLEFERTGDGFTCLSADSVTAEGSCTVVLKAGSWSGLFGRSFRIVNGPVSGGNWTARCSSGGLAARLSFDVEGVTVSFVKGFSLIIR